jgi:hypothetical protein
MGLPARQGKAANHGHAPRSEDERCRETDALPIAFKQSGNAHPLGMIAPESGVDSIDLLESVGEPGGRQIIRSEPPPQIGKRPSDRRESDADQREPRQPAGRAEARPIGCGWCIEVIRHLPLPSNRGEEKSCCPDDARNRRSVHCRAGLHHLYNDRIGESTKFELSLRRVSVWLRTLRQSG